MGRDTKTESAQTCEHAVRTILQGMAYVRGGFIIAPSEVKTLLAIKETNATWHLHRKVGTLRKALAGHNLVVEISAEGGMSITPPRPNREGYQTVCLSAQ